MSNVRASSVEEELDVIWMYSKLTKKRLENCIGLCTEKQPKKDGEVQEIYEYSGFCSGHSPTLYGQTIS